MCVNNKLLKLLGRAEEEGKTCVGSGVIRSSSKKRKTNLDNPLNANTGFGEDSLDVLAAHLGLVGDAAFDQVALCVGGDLARDEDIGACDDGLGLGVFACVSPLSLLFFLFPFAPVPLSFVLT